MPKISVESEKRAKLKLMIELEKRGQAAFKEILGKTYKDAAKSIEEKGYIDTAVYALSVMRLQTAFTRHYRNVSEVFGKRAMNTFAKQIGAKVATKASGVILKPPRKYVELFQAFIFAMVNMRSEEINMTTQNDISKILAESQGLTSTEIAGKIRTIEPALSAYRAAVIATTETHSAAMFAENTMTRELSTELDVITVKTWVAAEDSRTRPAHVAADGQQVEMEEKFKVGGELLDYPGDPKASAKNIINCRCVQIYDVVQEQTTTN